MYYVIPYNNDPIIEALPRALAYASLAEAKAVADKAASTGRGHWVVVKVEWVWSTKTLADLDAEKSAA